MNTITLGEMNDALDSVKQVITKTDALWQIYHFKDGELKVQSRNMKAGIPVMFDGEMIVPMADYDKIMKTLRVDPEVIIGPKQVVFKSGKTRATLSQIPVAEVFKVDELEGIEIDLDEKFMENLKILYPLIESADNPDFKNSVICINGKMIATHKGQIIIITEHEIFDDEDVKCLLPADLIRFLINKKVPPEEMILNKNAVQFKWPDDSWIISSLVAGSVPKKMFSLISSIEDCEWEMTDEHSQAIHDVIAMGASRITFDESGAWAEIDQGKFNTGIMFPLNETKKSVWDTRHLKIALNIADKFDFTQHPKPGTFSGEGVRGLIAPMLG
jgi:hypothetical protein